MKRWGQMELFIYTYGMCIVYGNLIQGRTTTNPEVLGFFLLFEDFQK